MAHALLAVTWQPELRGILVVIIGFVVLCGSVYMLLGTNLGARLGLLVAITGLFGWLVCLGIIWWTYGIGLKGQDPTWKPRAIINQPADLNQYQVIGTNDLQKATEGDKVNGWRLLAEDDPEHGNAASSADDILQNQAKRYKSGQYVVTAVYDKGGDRFPRIGKFDQLAFFHKPHYAIVQVQPTIPIATEPGRPPPKATPDPSKPPTFVLMERNLGNKRRPAAVITIGSAIIFGLLCWTLHRRDRLVAANRAGALQPAPTSGG
ncbi:MAG: hypothetical protein ACJ8H8_34050 [Geminicoccaceae bacterium]